jgi:hypothetical protein
MRAASGHAAATSGLEAPRSQDRVGVSRESLRSRLETWGAALDAGRLEHVLLVFLCFLAVIPILYLGRAADGNAFTSWRWTFTGARALGAVGILVPALVLALAVSRASLRLRVGPALVACVAGAAVLPLWAEPESVLDAARYLVQAKFLEEYGVSYFLREWGRGIDAWTDLPLVPFLYGLVFSVAGESRVFAQALDTFLFALTALLTFDIGRTLWDEETGLDAALLLVGIPFLLVQVPLLLVDVPAMFFLTVFVRAFLAAAGKGGAVRVSACALAASAAALAKYSLWPMLLVVPAAAIVVARDERGRVVARTIAVLLLVSLVVGAAIALRPDVFLRQAGLLATFQWAGLGRWQEGFLSTFAFQMHPFIVALALLGAARAAVSKDVRFLLAGGSLLLALPLGSTRARYVIPLLPLVVLAASYGLAAVRDRRGRRLVSLGVVATSLVVAWGAYLPFARSTSMANLARAGEHLDGIEGAVVEVHALPQPLSSGSTFAAIPLLGYATRKRIVCPEEWPVRGEDAATRTSSMRFSWELRRPPFYAAPGGIARAGAPVVVISGEPPGAPPGAALRERARFAATSDVFKYQTLVTVYTRDQGS